MTSVISYMQWFCDFLSVFTLPDIVCGFAEVLCVGQRYLGVRQESRRRGTWQDTRFSGCRPLRHLYQEQTQASGHWRRGVHTPPQGQLGSTVCPKIMFQNFWVWFVESKIKKNVPLNVCPETLLLLAIRNSVFSTNYLTSPEQLTDYIEICLAMIFN